MLITVFTPAFNRAYTLQRLYESLVRQSEKSFEWLVVDDGSTDGTRELVEKFADEGVITIRYLWQPNQGKHYAINRGVREALGELFFIVDSDDYLTDIALERMNWHWRQVEGCADFCGISANRFYAGGETIGGRTKYGVLDTDSLTYRWVHKVRGDKAEAFRTRILREFPFPEFPGEKFCAESLVFNRLARQFRIRYFSEDLYCTEYLPDGLSASSLKNRVKSPKGTLLYYRELSAHRIPLWGRIRALMNIVRFYILTRFRQTQAGLVDYQRPQI